MKKYILLSIAFLGLMHTITIIPSEDYSASYQKGYSDKLKDLALTAVISGVGTYAILHYWIKPIQRIIYHLERDKQSIESALKKNDSLWLTSRKLTPEEVEYLKDVSVDLKDAIRILKKAVSTKYSTTAESKTVLDREFITQKLKNFWYKTHVHEMGIGKVDFSTWKINNPQLVEDLEDLIVTHQLDEKILALFCNKYGLNMKEITKREPK